MPDKYGFNYLPSSEKVEVSCIECDIRGPYWDWNEEKREMHYLGHNNVVCSTGEETPGISFTGNLRHGLCRTCKEPFFQERKRGRPRLTCENCG